MINKEDVEYVGFWDRFHAVLVMSVIIVGIEVLLSLIFFDNYFLDAEEMFDTQDILLGYILPFILTLWIWHKYSSDPGKMLYKAKIVDAMTFEKPTTKQFIIRYVGYYLSLLPLGLGYFWVIWDKKKQSFHDKLAHTVVVKPAEENKKTPWYIHIYRVFIVLVGLLILLGVVLSFYEVKNKPLVKGDSIEKEKIEMLMEHKVIEKAEELQYYGEFDSLFGAFQMKSIITTSAICNIGFQDEKPMMGNNCYDFKKVGNLVIEKRPEDDDFYLYDSDIYTHAYVFGEDDFFDENLTEYGLYEVMTVSPKEQGTFKENVMSLWREAKGE